MLQRGAEGAQLGDEVEEERGRPRGAERESRCSIQHRAKRRDLCLANSSSKGKRRTPKEQEGGRVIDEVSVTFERPQHVPQVQ